jgi:hypothetical protein
MKTKLIGFFSSTKGQSMLKLTGFALAIIGLGSGLEGYELFDHPLNTF